MKKEITRTGVFVILTLLVFLFAGCWPSDYVTMAERITQFLTDLNEDAERDNIYLNVAKNL